MTDSGCDCVMKIGIKHKGCSDLFGVGGTGSVCVQITGSLTKANWRIVEAARRRDARRQGR
jgi:hypothetical protein